MKLSRRMLFLLLICSQAWSAPAPLTAARINGKWRFEGGSGSTVASSASFSVGTAVNSPTYVAGKIGNALQFNGTNQYVTIPDYVLLHVTTFTFVAWIRVDSWPTTSGYIFGQGSDGTSEPFYVRVTNTKTLEIGKSGSSAVTADLSSWNTGEWHYIAVGTDSVKWVIYLDGVLTTSTTLSGVTANTADLAFGAFNNNGTYSNFFNGAIDEAFFHNKLLNSALIRMMMLGFYLNAH